MIPDPESGLLIRVPLYNCYRVGIGHGIRRGASFLFRSIKLNVSLRACAAFNRYIKITKIFRDYQIGTISRGRLTLSAIVCVWCMCVSIASTSVTPEHRHRCRCKARASTRTPICSQGIAHSATKFRHTFGCCASVCPTHRGRLIESQPTLGLWVMSAADNGATVTAEQSDAPLWSQNLPPQLS